jgi:extracellular factor (EF) 3-hydroxypalmitic acid methyl ester biosynthesis protein
MMYRAAPEGDTAIGRGLHQWVNSLRPSRAVRNRRGWILDRIAEHAAEQPGGLYRVTSVACGPAQEVQDLARSRALDGALEVTCLDQDREALAFAEAAVARACADSGATLRATFEPESVKKILASRTRRAGAQPLQNFVYSMGLYDYLSQRAGIALTRALYERLAPGGRLVVGNFVPCAATRFVMETVSDWALIHRTAPQMRGLADGLPADARVEFATEPTGLNGFLVVDRPRAC